MQPDGNPRHFEHPTRSSGLLADVQHMEPAAWSRLVNTFGPIVYRWCRASGVREADAADLVQEVFVAVSRNIGDFERHKAEGSFRSWLATITRNRVRDHYRRQAKIQQAVGGTEALARLEQQAESIDTTISPESAEQPLLHHELGAVQAEFEPSTWQAFWMTAVEGQAAAEVATQIGTSVDSVYQAKSRVLRRLRQRLADVPR